MTAVRAVHPLRLEHPLMNAAGTVKLVDQAVRLAQAPVAGLMMGSYTTAPRAGNAGVTYFSTSDGYTLNRRGMPNHAIEYLRDVAEVVKDTLGDRPLFASVAGFGLDDYLSLIERVPSTVDQVEVNLGCPNVDGERIGSFDLDLIDDVLRCADRRVGLKLSPYSDPSFLSEVASIVSGRVAFLTLSNTFPNGWRHDALGGGYGGVAGAAVRPIVLGQIHQFGSLLPDMPIIAAGGFRDGSDWPAYSAAGACAVQVASRFFDGQEDPDIFAAMHADMVST